MHIWNSRANPTFWAPAVDPGWYDQTALNILHGDWGEFPLFRAPLYQLLLAGVYGILGHDLVAARILNVVVQGAAVWVIWKAARSYFSAAVGVLAAFLFAVNGMAIFYAGEILSTSLEMLAAAVGMWMAFRLLRDPSLLSAFVCGLAWGTAAVVRPNFLIVMPVILAAIWLSKGAAARWRRTALLAAGTLLPIIPVTAVNYVKGHEFVLIATQGGVNFWIGNNPESTGVLSVLPGYGNAWTMEDAENAAEREVGRPLHPGELSNFYYSKGRQFLMHDPLLSLRFMIRKTLLFFNRFEISNNKHIAHFASLSPWLPWLILLDFGVLLPLAFVGLWVLWWQPETKLLLWLILFYAASVVLYFVTSRFRMPVVPWLCVLAAGGVVWVVETIRLRVPARRWWPVALLIPGAALAYLNVWNLTEAPIGWARYMEGNAFLKLGQLDSSRVCFQDAIRDGQATAKAYMNLGVVEYQSGHYQRAREDYEHSLSFDALNPDAWNNLGTVLEQLNDTTGAVAAYEQALHCKPSAPDPRHNLAAVHFRLGIAALKRGEDYVAIMHLEKCLNLEPTAVTHYDLAIACGRTGQNESAVEHLEEALRLDRNFTAAQNLLFQIRSGSPKWPQAGGTSSDSNPD
jgi:Flp pilus assembly protein TadD/4-amino-4-deoxy-L-arabinose transferase-like glycosyltransferase